MVRDAKAGWIGRVGRLVALAGAMSLFGRCAPLRIETDYDPEVAFEAMRTFAWIDSAGPERDREQSPFLARRLRRAVDAVLRDRGFRPAENGADLLVTGFVLEAPFHPGRWALAPRCGPVVSVRIGLAYPFGLSFRRPWHPFARAYWRSPWGYACAYRIGVGYVWFPIYEEPGRRLPGTVVIDVLDGRTREPVWRGWAEGALWDAGAWSASQDEVDAIVARIMADFPPTAP